MYRVTSHAGRTLGTMTALLLSAAVIALAAVIAGCGSEPDRTPEERTPVPAATASPAEGWFYDLKPRAGDILVPPRIGLRWQYLPSTSGPAGSSPAGASASDTLLGGVRSAGVAFRVHVVDSLDIPYIRTETSETDIRVTLPPRTPPGTYSWWVESFAEGDTTILAASDRQTFEIERQP